VVKKQKTLLFALNMSREPADLGALLEVVNGAAYASCLTSQRVGNGMASNDLAGYSLSRIYILEDK
jgi:hypothetical protein